MEALHQKNIFQRKDIKEEKYSGTFSTKDKHLEFMNLSCKVFETKGKSVTGIFKNKPNYNP